MKLNSLIKDQKLHAVSQIWNIVNAKNTNATFRVGGSSLYEKYYRIVIT